MSLDKQCNYALGSTKLLLVIYVGWLIQQPLIKYFTRPPALFHTPSPNISQGHVHLLSNLFSNFRPLSIFYLFVIGGVVPLLMDALSYTIIIFCALLCYCCWCCFAADSPWFHLDFRYKHLKIEKKTIVRLLLASLSVRGCAGCRFILLANFVLFALCWFFHAHRILWPCVLHSEPEPTFSSCRIFVVASNCCWPSLPVEKPEAASTARVVDVSMCMYSVFPSF